MSQYPKVLDLTNKFPSVLLLGNGILQSCKTEDGRSSECWEARIKRLSGEVLTEKKKRELQDIPYAVQAAVSAPVNDSERHERYRACFDTLEYANDELLRKLVSLPFDAILTTNYTYEIENVFQPAYSHIKDKQRYAISYQTDTKYLLHTCNVLSDGPPIWHIHGETRRKSSIVMTHDEYARLLQKLVDINRSVAGSYAAFTKSIHYSSWFDYFLMSDLYIVGLGMDFSEIDLWWLLNRRRREKAKNGKIVFYRAMYDSPAISNALKMMNVEVVEPDIDAENKEQYYETFYNTVIDDIQKRRGL